MPDENDKFKDALNRHGVFLKKALLEQLPPSQLEIHEELGFSFGGTRVADIVAIEKFQDRTLYIVIECKRVADDRRWLFYRHVDRSIRIARHIGGSTHKSSFRQLRTTSCSEGFEYPLRDKKEHLVADQDPVFRAASQLSAAYLGLAQDRWRNHATGLPAEGERFVPILVTTARLSIVLNSFDAAQLTTGRLDDALDLQDVDELVLKHPFPTPEGMNDDFRRHAVDPWHHRFAESINIVRADALSEFLSPGRRQGFAFADKPFYQQ
jgi:hypothetical protein